MQDQQDRKGKVRLKQEITLTQELIKQEEDGSVDMSLYKNINKRKKAGTSRSKGKSTISKKAYANMKKGFPKKKFKSGGPVKSGIAKGCGRVMDNRRKVTKFY